MKEKIQAIRAQLEAAAAQNAADVEALRIRFLSKKGEISALMNDFRSVAAEQKRELGQALNELKNFATERINSLRDEIENASPFKCFFLQCGVYSQTGCLVSAVPTTTS